MLDNRKTELKNMLIGIGVLILYLIASYFSYDFIELFGISYDSLPLIGRQIYLLSYQIILTLIIVYIYRKTFIPDFKDFIKNNASYFKKYIKYWFLMLGLMIFSNLIVTLFTTSAISENQQNIIDTLKMAPIYTFILTVFVAPILEELVFRLSFKKMFAHTNFLFILFSGLIFGSMHVVNSFESLVDLLFIIPYSIPGFIFAYVYSKSKNICVPMSLHFIHNGIMMSLQILLTLLT